jgi:hypothetical protein
MHGGIPATVGRGRGNVQCTTKKLVFEKWHSKFHAELFKKTAHLYDHFCAAARTVFCKTVVVVENMQMKRLGFSIGPPHNGRQGHLTIVLEPPGKSAFRLCHRRVALTNKPDGGWKPIHAGFVFTTKLSASPSDKFELLVQAAAGGAIWQINADDFAMQATDPLSGKPASYFLDLPSNLLPRFPNALLHLLVIEENGGKQHVLPLYEPPKPAAGGAAPCGKAGESNVDMKDAQPAVAGGVPVPTVDEVAAALGKLFVAKGQDGFVPTASARRLTILLDRKQFTVITTSFRTSVGDNFSDGASLAVTVCVHLDKQTSGKRA